jgi:hypothetical protein
MTNEIPRIASTPDDDVIYRDWWVTIHETSRPCAGR